MSKHHVALCSWSIQSDRWLSWQYLFYRSNLSSSFAQLSCIFLYQKLSTYPSNMVFIRHRNLFFSPSAKDLINMHYQSPRIEDIHTCDSLDNCYCLNQYHPAQITSTQHLRKCIHIHSPSSITWVPSRQKIPFFFSLKPMYKGSSMSLQLRQEGSLRGKKKKRNNLAWKI